MEIQNIHNITNYTLNTTSDSLKHMLKTEKKETVDRYYEHMLAELKEYKESSFAMERTEINMRNIVYNLKVYIMVNTTMMMEMSEEQIGSIRDIVKEFGNEFPYYRLDLYFWFNSNN